VGDDKDGQQWGSAKHDDAGLEEGGERFSQYNTSLYGQTADNCCTSPSRGILMPNDQLHGNDGMSHYAKLEVENGSSMTEKQEQCTAGHA
jgi:hypothetical protein